VGASRAHELLRDQLQAALGDTYRIERELSGGAMSRVFVAEETRLRRLVVVKVLPPDLAGAVSVERFEREILVGAGLQHPHIVPVLTAGDVARIPYFTMPYIEGESLAARIRAGGELPVGDAIRVLRHVASALEYAHARGVVHRDIKPANVLLSGGYALVTDFGLAKALDAASTAGSGISSLGVAVGTPAYMAPEQALADPLSDHRADLYAWGVVAYECLSGKTPFADRSLQATIAAQIAEAPSDLAEHRPQAPLALRALIMHTLEKRPADRPQSAGEIVQALDALTSPSGGVVLGSGAGASGAASGRGVPAVTSRASAWRWVGGAAVAVLALAALLVRGRQRSTGASAVSATPSAADSAAGSGAVAGAGLAGSAPIALAVLPFDDGGAASRRYFADGITDEVRGKLASLPGLEVIAGGSSEQYRQTTKSPAEIGRELGVRYLLVGRIEWQERRGHLTRVRVAPELVQVAGVRTPTTRWAHPFDAELSDVFRVQGEIAEQVATALDVTIGQSARTTIEARPTRSLPAYDAFLRGEAIRATSGSNAAALRRARAAYDSAVALDSSFALAWAEMSITSSLLFHDETPQPADRDRARIAADRALALDRSLADGYRALGDYYRLCLDDIRTAGATYRRGLAIAPRSVPLLAASARAARTEGRWDEAVARYRDAGLLDPRDAGIADALAFAELYQRHYGEAASAADRALQLAPSNPRYWETAAMIALAEGDLDSARAVIRRAAPAVGDTTLIAYVAQYADLYWVLDDRQQRALLAFTPEPFDGDRVGWGLALAGTSWVRGDRAAARAYADSARAAAVVALAHTPDDAQTHAQLGVALAFLGDSTGALREGARASALVPITRDAYDGVYYQHQLARIHALLGDGPGTATALAPVLAVPYYVSRAWIAIDPTFATVRDSPALRNLLASR